MTPDENSEKIPKEEQLERIVQGVKEVNEKLGKITGMLYDCIDAKQPYDNDWAEYYELDDYEEHL